MNSMRDRSLFSLSGPILFELLMLYMVPAVDAFYMSKISSEAVAAVSAILPLTAVGFILFIPITQAGSSVAAQHLGAKNEDLARLTFSLMLLGNLALGVVVGLFFFLFANVLPGLVGLDAELGRLARLYMQALSMGYVFLALRVSASGVLSALGRTHANMWIAVMMNLINLVINHLTVTGIFGLPKYGVSGIAVASATAWLVSFLVGLSLCYRHLASPSFLLEHKEKAKQTLRHVLRIGIPSTLEPLSYQVSQVAISRILVGLGVLTITTKAYVANTTLFSLLWSAAFASGTQIKVAYLLGEKAYKDASRELMFGVKVALIGCTCMSVALAIGGPWILRIFTSDPDILKLGSRILWIAVFLEWGRALNVIVGSALRASGDARFVALFGMFSMWLVAVGGSYFLGLRWGWGLMGIWMVMSFDEHLRGWVSLKRWLSGHWQTKTVYR